jgi:hypothetical protein
MRFPLSDDAEVALGQWSASARTLFEELIEDAGSELQRELLARALAAGHRSSEVHAFADQIRSLRDPALFEACTFRAPSPGDFTVAELLRAEADPLYAFGLNGGTIEPRDDRPRPRAEVSMAPLTPPASPLSQPMGARKPAFDSQGSGTRRAVPPAADALGSLLTSPSGLHVAPTAAVGEPLAEGPLNDATRSLGVAWRETDLDTRGGVALGDALAVAATALARGIPVPCTMGPGVGQHRRFVLLLQISSAGKSRAWQLYDPLSRELVWANESDLLAARELPFANKVNRRLTRIVLPRAVKPSS